MTLVLLTLLSQWSDFPGSKPAAAPAQAQTQAKPSGNAQDRYAQATRLISSRQFGEATAILNELAPTNPKWAEVYAARCSAQLGLKRPDTAAADCRYAWSLQPTLFV